MSATTRTPPGPSAAPRAWRITDIWSCLKLRTGQNMINSAGSSHHSHQHSTAHNHWHFRLYGGQLVVLETRAEWACIEHWVEKAYQPAYQRYAISLKKSNIGDYRWFYADGSNAFPDYCNAACCPRKNNNMIFLQFQSSGPPDIPVMSPVSAWRLGLEWTTRQCSPLSLVQVQRGSALIGPELQSVACASSLMP